MSHSYGNGNSNGNNYLNKKRLEEDIPMENRYHFDKYDKYDKYRSHSRYNNTNYIHSKPPQGNNYYNTSARYGNNYYNNPKTYHNNSYSNKMPQKREYKKPYPKYSNPNANEGIRNLSHCEMPSPPPLSLKSKSDGDSLKTISTSNTLDNSKSNSNSSICSNKGINIKDILNLTSSIPSGRGQPIFSQQNINIEIKLTSPSSLKYKDKKILEHKEENKRWRKDDEDKKDEEIPVFKFPKPSEKLLNYEPFNRNSIKIEENPLENFEIYSKNLYEFNLDNIPKKQNNTINDSIFNDNIENTQSIKSCYLLAKIPNWRLVTNFVPASSLTEEKFKNIIPLEEDDDRTEELEPGKESPGKESKKKESQKKSYLVYFQKYEETAEKYLEQNMTKKRQVKKEIFNQKYIIAQFHYDILKYKNKIKQNKYKINYLNIKQDNTKNALDERNKD